MTCWIVTTRKSQMGSAQEDILSPSSINVAENDPVTLTCNYDLTKVQGCQWSLKNMRSYVISKDCQDIGTPKVNTTLYSFLCDGTFTWTIKQVTRENDGDIWQCVIFPLTGQTLQSNEVKINVEVPVQNVTMTSPKGSVVTVRENTETVFVCSTSGGLPAATVRWYKDQRTAAASDDIEITTHATVTISKTNDGLVSVTSTLRYSPRKEDNGIKLYCTANNSAIILTSVRKPQLNVQYSPDDSPKIQGYSNGDTYTVVENNQGLLSCSIKGGNPLATLSWNCYNTGSPAETVGTTVIKNVTWTALRNHERTCTCQSSHVTGDKQAVSVDIQILNQTSVSSFFVEGNEGQDNVTVNEHDDIQFTCVVDSNPAPSMKLTFENKTLKEVTHATTLSFTLRNAACLHGGVFTCEGRNDFVQSSSKIIRLFVRCSPRPLHQLKQNITSSMYLPVTMSVTVLAYPEPKPGPEGYSWYKEDSTRWTPLLSNADLQILSSGLQSNLTILNVSQSDYGQYRVTIANILGTYEQYLFLTGIQEYTSIGTTTATESITCTGNKNPQTDNTGLIIGVVTLGLFSFVVVVYATVVTILFKRKITNKDIHQLDNTRSQTTYANLGYKSNVTEEQECTNHDQKMKEEDSDKQYTSLVPSTRDDNTAYDVIQTQ